MYQLQDYLEMMRDPCRMGPLDAALRKVIRPGDVVLDLGAGTGVLSFISLDAGAEHVYAIEQSPAIEVARKIARANGLADRVTFIRADARTVTPPRQVDCLVADIRGTLPLHGENIDLFEKVRHRWLRPGGQTVPLTDELFVAPVCARIPHERVVGWSEERPEAQYEVARRFAANTWVRAILDAADVMAPAQAFGEIRYDGDSPRKFGTRTSFVIESGGVLTGLGVWFRGTFAKGIAIDTSPFSPPSIYSQGFFPLMEARTVEPGEKIEVDLSVYRIAPEPIWIWKVQSEKGPAWSENHSTLEGAMLVIDLSFMEGSRYPSLSEDGTLASRVLSLIDGRTSARTIAARLVSELPARFSTEDEALPHVIRLLTRYASP